MQNTTTLFLMNGDTPDAVVTGLAEAAANTQAHLSCLIIETAPDLPMTAYGIPPYGAWSIPDNWGEKMEDAHQRQNKRVQEIEQLLARANTSGDVQSAFCVASEIKYHVGRKARVSDIAYIAPNMRDNKDVWREASHGVLFHSPIGLIANATGTLQPKRIFIAWDSSKASSRAVHAALPYLKEADEVVIACFDPLSTAGADGEDPGTGLASWLSHHGCTVTVSQYPSGGKEIGEAIEKRAREFGADLVVMGAYGHARMLQAVFGGTTTTMIDQTELPVLLAH
jgi:nucleotide-binding universal stress UspA family protein